MKQENTNDITLEKKANEQTNKIAPGEIVIGLFSGIDEKGRSLVNFTNNPTDDPLIAVSTLGLNQMHVARQVALLFIDGELTKPVIMGLIHSPLDAILDNFQYSAFDDKQDEETIVDNLNQQTSNLNDASVDGKRVVIEGKDEIVLKCGAASITLTKAGKILIRGKYLLNRSTGVNRIMGGSVQVN